MALSYSQSEWFVPSLRELNDAEQNPTQRCVWHKSKRAPKRDGAQLVRCSNSVGQQFTRISDRLLEDLRKAPEGGEACPQILRELSSLSLCWVHRPSNAETVCNFWISELKISTPISETPKQAPKLSEPTPSIHQIGSTEVLEQLGITVGIRTHCHGRGQRGTACGNWIKQSNGERIVTIATELAEDWGVSSTALRLLKELSELAMCLRWHQDQAPLKLKDWTTIIKSKVASSDGPQVIKATVIPRTPTRQWNRSPEIETPETKMSAVWTSPRQARSPESAVTTPSSSPSLSRTTFRPFIETDVRQPVFGRLGDQSPASPTPISSRTRASIRDGQRGSTTLAGKSQTFEPLPTVKSPLQAAQYVMEKIKESISSAEVANGFVYGFRRFGCDLIKIGMTTKTVNERLGRIGRQCKYRPTVIFQVATKHAMKVERLVHRQLYRQNRRENLVDGLCNNGSGCSSKHKEWFEDVSDAYAESVVRAWVSWINLEPYDKNGKLKEAWVLQTKCFDLAGSGDIWRRWTQITLVQDIKREATDEDLNSAIIKTETALSVSSWLSSQLVPPKSVISVTMAEIRGDIPLVAPISLASPIHVSA